MLSLEITGITFKLQRRDKLQFILVLIVQFEQSDSALFVLV